jgi:nitrile hydratase
MPNHDHGHVDTEGSGDYTPGYYEILERSLAELLVEKGRIDANDIRREIEVLDSRNPALGARLVARAWCDAEFKKRLLANGRKACEELGITSYEDTELIVLENTESVHNLVVCTLCSCYPRAVIGLPPDWYKLKPYRARAVKEPRTLLKEFGTFIPDDMAIYVSDATAQVRYLVLPQRPIGTEDFTEEELGKLVTRDSMIGVVRLDPVQAHPGEVP